MPLEIAGSVRPPWSTQPSEDVIRSLIKDGCAVFHSIYPIADCAALAAEAAKYPTQQDSAIIGKTMADLGVQVAKLDPGNGSFLTHTLHTLIGEINSLFPGDETFKNGCYDPQNWEALLYPEKSAVMPRHRDWPKHLNLVCTLTLAGSTIFSVWNTEGIRQDHTLSPGTLALLPAPGFMGEENPNPFHQVDGAPDGRIVICLRETRSP